MLAALEATESSKALICAFCAVALVSSSPIEVVCEAKLAPMLLSWTPILEGVRMEGMEMMDGMDRTNERRWEQERQ